MPKYCNKSVITQDIHMSCSMATTNFGETVGTQPTFSGSEKPKPLLLQLTLSLPIWGLGAQRHCRRPANSGETRMEQTILERSLRTLRVEGDTFGRCSLRWPKPWCSEGSSLALPRSCLNCIPTSSALQAQPLGCALRVQPRGATAIKRSK